MASLLLFSTMLTLEPPNSADFDVYIGGELVGSDAPGELANTAEFKVGSSTGTVRRSLQVLDDSSMAGKWLIGLAGDRIGRLHEMPREKAVETLFLGLRRMLPLALILFVPLLALGLKLLYIRRRANHHLYLHHLVFAVHYQTALFFALSATWAVVRLARIGLLGGLFAGTIVLSAALFVYMPWALRTFYGQSRLWTAIKAFAVLFLYSQLLPLVVSAASLVAIWDA